MEKVIKSVRQHLLLETEAFEEALCIANKSSKVNIDNINNKILYGKLDDYKTICFGYLLNKYGKEQLDEIIKEYNLEV